MSIQIGRAALGGRPSAGPDDGSGRPEARRTYRGRAGGVADRRSADSDRLVAGTAMFTGRWMNTT